MDQPKKKEETPKYDLDEIKSLIRAGDVIVTGKARDNARALNFTYDDIIDCVLSLSDRVFYGAMEADDRPGFFQDVYHPRLNGTDLYVKLQIDEDAIVIQFKRQ